MVDGLGQHVAEVAQKGLGPGRADPSSAGVDPGPPQRLVGVDIAYTGDRALGQQLGLDSASAGGERSVEAWAVQERIERFGSDVVEGG